MSACTRNTFGESSFSENLLTFPEHLFPIFRFDDIYLGIVALKSEIEPLHSDEFYFYKAEYTDPQSYKYVVASHGYDKSDDMIRIWTQQRANGYA